MSIPKSCCAPCPEVETVNVPGAEGEAGADGADGANGVNAFTVVTVDFEVPVVGDDVTIDVGNSTFLVVGQNFFVQGAGYFEVVSKPTTTSVIGTYLDYTANTHTGETISAGAGVSPSGTQGPSESLIPAIPDYALAQSTALATSAAQLAGLSITLTEARTYLLLATVRLDFDVATFSAEESVELKLRRTNNSPADIANAIANLNTGVTSLESSTFATVALPPVTYAASAGDIVQLFGTLSDTPYSGALNAIEGSIVAIPLF